jgi:hypothetical protein
MNLLALEIVRAAENTPLLFEPRRMINAGYVGRDQAAVRHHIEELQREGVAAPPSVPMLFPMVCANVTTSSRIEVVEEKTSGEVEFVLLMQGDRIFVGIGSDHTDRLLEAIDMLKSKQACPNVLGHAVWDYEDVREHWDRLTLKSWVRLAPTQEWVPYQSMAVAAILSPEQILDLVRSSTVDHRLDDTIIFSGTVPIIGGQVIYGSSFRCELHDPFRQRSLHCVYDVVHLTYLQPAARVMA